MNLVPYISNRVHGSASADLAELLGWSTPAVSSGFRFHEDKDLYQAEIDLPGVRKEAVQLNVEGDALTLTAERQVGFAEAKRTVAITRGLTLPDDVNAEAIKADFRDGVLTLTFPKKEESKPKQLKISVD
jgi:HSP20 family molecular chaperone IbpA